MRPLPRSLDPLPGESLPGYLLRLSCRLDLAPGRVLQLTGLSTSDPGPYLSAPRGHMMVLDAATALSFAHATRLTTAEITGLCMISLAGRYPWAAPAITHDQWGPRPVTSPWVFTSATRYCPQCLAGDGSSIQQRYGGPWRKTWRLPVVFSCPVHRRLLDHLCPSCQQPALADGTSASLVPRLRDSGLHPAQCRTALRPGPGSHRTISCGARLDAHPQHAGQPPAGLHDLLAVQDRLLRLLHPCGPATTRSAGRPATTPQYFADLRMVCSLITAAWPAGRNLIPAQPLADALGDHLAKVNATTHRHYDTPPLDPLPCAALITAAVRVLDDDDRQAFAQHLTPIRDSVIRKSPQARWTRRYRAIEPQCSDGLRDALQPLVHTYHRAGRQPGARRAPAPNVRFGPEHIPEQLQDDWFDRHFRHLGGASPRLIRRAAAVRLVQMAAGGPLSDAAAFLGIDHRYASASLSSTLATAASDASPAQFRIAVHALAQQLNDTRNLIDYQHRRAALRTWCIDIATWQTLTGQLPRTKGPFQPDLGDCKREFASQIVWTRITHGEHLLAPCPIQDQQPRPDPTWTERRTSMWSACLASPPKPHYTDLNKILRPHADSLAATIDLQRSARLQTDADPRQR